MVESAGGRRDILELDGVLHCDCSHFRREFTCNHIAEWVAAKRDEMPLEDDTQTIRVPLFIDPPVVAEVVVESLDDAEMWHASLYTDGWAAYPYERVRLGIITPGTKRLTLRYMIVAWLVAQEDLIAREGYATVPVCQSKVHTPHFIEAGSKERLSNLWFLLRYRKCSQCFFIEKAAKL